jgi:serine/threonine protein kinase
MTSAVGFLPYQAPEVFRGGDYSEKADVYSFGMLVWFIYAARPPEQGIKGLWLTTILQIILNKASIPL